MTPARISRFALCLALLCVAAQAAHALQLGETREQMLARHGAPGAEDHARNLAAYFWEGWSAQLEFENNVVRKLTYRRNWYLQETEITSLLESNGGVSHWRETSAPEAPARQWTRDDGASATCAHLHPLSFVFQAAGLTAASQQGPKIMVAATPNSNPSPDPSPASPKTPTFPKMLGTVPEAELPLADPPSAAPPPAPERRTLPNLPAAKIEPEAKSAPPAEAAPSPVVPEPKPAVARGQKPAAEPPDASPARDSHVFGYILGSLGLLCTLAGGGLYFRKRQSRPSRAPHMKVSAAETMRDTPGSLAGLEALRKDQVELLIGEIFRRNGYTVELSAALNTDDGIDLMLRRDSETTLVQCKHWKAARVCSREIREFYGAMAAGGAPHGILVTTGAFTPDAREFAEGKGIELLDGDAVASTISALAQPGENLCAVSTWLDDFIAHARIFDPECPVCHGTMVIRHNRASGAPSWACRGYPRCPGRREPRLDLLPTATAH